MKGLKRSIRNVISEFKIIMLHSISRIKASKYRKSTNLKLHIGSGSKLKEGWINIDFNNMADLSLDMRERLPLPDSSCSIIYSEHFIEHLEYPHDALYFLQESFRVLKSGGMFSVAVPDTEWPILSYVKKNDEYFKIVKKLWHPEWCYTRMEHINYHFRQGNEHYFAYDYETLKHILEKAGFENIRQRSFDTELDSKDREVGTLYVKADKG